MSAVVRFSTNVVEGDASTDPPVSVYDKLDAGATEPLLKVYDTVLGRPAMFMLIGLNEEPLTVSEKVNSSWSVLKSSLKLDSSGPVVTDTNVLADFSPASASDATATPVVSAAKLPSTDRTPPPSS